MKYTLRQLQVFLAVAHYQNVSRAAAELSMSQSAASGALKELETAYEVQLFDRVGKRLQINELGRSLRPRAEALLTQARELELELARHHDAGDLTVGATLTIGNYLCVGLIQEYMRETPDSRVKLEVANTDTIAREILNFEIDIGMIEGDYNHPDLDILPWRADELVCFCAPDHPLARRGSLDQESVQNASWILREPGSGTRQTFDRALHNLLPSLNITLELQHTEAIKRAVEAGLGVSCLSRIALKEAFMRGSLVPLEAQGFDFHRQLYIVIHRHKYRSAGINRWLDVCGLGAEANDRVKGMKAS